VRRTDLPAPEQLEPLGEDLLELGDRTSLEQHVPVRADRLLDLDLTRQPVLAQRFRAAARALPDRRYVGLDRHRDLEVMALRAAVGDVLTSRELDAALVLEALAPESGATQSALSHEPPPDVVSPLVDIDGRHLRS
jgi:hypothetical protein